MLWHYFDKVDRATILTPKCSSSHKGCNSIYVTVCVIDLGYWHCFSYLFYCPLKWYQPFHLNPYEHCVNNQLKY